MSNRKLSTALCYGILAGTGAICYLTVNRAAYARFAYMALMSNGILGLLKLGEIEGLDSISQIVETTQDIFVLPSITTTIWVEYNNCLDELALANIFMSNFLLVSFILENKTFPGSMKNVLINANISTMLLLSLIHSNIAGLVATAIYAYADNVIKKNKKTIFDMESEDIYNCALSLFAGFSLLTMSILSGHVDIDIDSISKLMETIQDLFLLPCISSTIWVAYGYMKELALLNVLLSFSPLLSFIFEHKPITEELKNTIVTVNVSTIAALSLIHDNFAGLASMVIFSFAHTQIKKNKETFFELDSQEVYNCAISLFAITSLLSILSIK